MFIPLGDDNSRRKITPILVWVILATNLVVWFLQLTLGEPFTYGYSTIPYEIMNGVDLTGAQDVRIMGQNISIEHARGPYPIYLTIISSMFMHGSWEHIIGNMLYLIIFADQIEDILGRKRFMIFYLICGASASLAHILVSPNSIIPSLGASGAIAGVLGAYLVNFPSNTVRVLLFRDIVLLPASIVLGGWILLQFIAQISVVSGAPSGVAYMAHIGGFIIGVPLSYFMRQKYVL